jgi:hypothetical protein
MMLLFPGFPREAEKLTCTLPTDRALAWRRYDPTTPKPACGLMIVLGCGCSVW